MLRSFSSLWTIVVCNTSNLVSCHRGSTSQVRHIISNTGCRAVNRTDLRCRDGEVVLDDDRQISKVASRCVCEQRQTCTGLLLHQIGHACSFDRFAIQYVSCDRYALCGIKVQDLLPMRNFVVSRACSRFSV